MHVVWATSPGVSKVVTGDGRANPITLITLASVPRLMVEQTVYHVLPYLVHTIFGRYSSVGFLRKKNILDKLIWNKIKYL